MSVNQSVDAVRDFVSLRSAPAVTSVSADTHIFHFDPEGFWEDSPILLVNRNGHHFRVIPENGSFLFAKTWNGLFDVVPWQVEANLRRTDAKKLIDLCGIGPQGNRGKQFETLSLLPKEATLGRRKAVWRQHMMDVAFDRDNNVFTLIIKGANDSEVRQTFAGKLWESHEATKFCAEQFADQAPKIVAAAQRGPLTQQQAEALEDSPLWGMF